MTLAAYRECASLVELSGLLARDAGRFSFGAPVSHIYNPLEYAVAPLRQYLDTYGTGRKDVLLVGMNPGPFGMAQTGVPFGDVEMVRDWLRIVAPVNKPPIEHPKRPVLGFACPRGEISGKRLWGWARDRFEAPEVFFQRFFVWNYCPLCFMSESGANLTPDRIPASESEALFLVCDAALWGVCKILRPGTVVGVGGFADRRCREALTGLGVRIGRMPHPSPASPAANRGWARLADRVLAELGVL